MGTQHIAKTIFDARKRMKLKQEALGALIGCSGSYITKLEKGSAIPSPILAMKLEKALRLKKSSVSDLVLNIKMKEARLKLQAIAEARSDSSKPSYNNHTMVPFYRSSKGFDGDGKPESYVAIPDFEVNGRKLFLLKVEDDCNDLSGLMKGDTLVVESGDGKSGEICVYKVGANYFIKMYRKLKDGVQLMPNSSNGRHMVSRHKNGSDITWKGTVTALYLKKIIRKL